MIYTTIRTLEIQGDERTIYIARDDNEPQIVEVGFNEEQAKARAQLALKNLHMYGSAKHA